MSSPALDAFDRAILTILQRDNRTPQRTIGAAVNLSAAAVQRRIRRMEESGVIRSNVAIADPERVARPLTLIVEVEVESERAEQLDDLKRRFRNAPEIQQCYYVTGETDFMLVVSAASMAEYEDLTRRLFFADDNVKRFRTFVAMDRVKVSLALPLDNQTN
jgi:Lrp/AsnC family leucine-responsive transcriptional regulator